MNFKDFIDGLSHSAPERMDPSEEEAWKRMDGAARRGMLDLLSMLDDVFGKNTPAKIGFVALTLADGLENAIVEAREIQDEEAIGEATRLQRDVLGTYARWVVAELSTPETCYEASRRVKGLTRLELVGAGCLLTPVLVDLLQKRLGP